MHPIFELSGTTGEENEILLKLRNRITARTIDFRAVIIILLWLKLNYVNHSIPQVGKRKKLNSKANIWKLIT
ncbi:hypothetical protein BH10BAC5_BH10BAC5_08030 [soil metagenome]